ncbi:MAG TPA: flavodoxin family protein [Desulfobacterales bacterium]|nr:flavodoxin family protein [Desulfobacterales bacterium]
MKVLAISGSARKGGNTAQLLTMVLDGLAAEGAETELFELAGRSIQGCIACYKCFEQKDGKCAVDDDVVNECLSKMRAADAIILGSPTYFADVSASMKALIERCGMVARANDNMLKRKLGAGVVAVRRAGAYHVFSTLNSFFLIGEMIVVGSSYWNIGLGRDKGEVQKDEEGVKTMRDLAGNMAWLLKKIEG